MDDSNEIIVVKMEELPVKREDSPEIESLPPSVPNNPHTMAASSPPSMVPLLPSSTVPLNTPSGSATSEGKKLKAKANLQNRLLSKHDEDFLCLVCSDRASGYHYGVPACEGCKAFFKRSLQSKTKESSYKCPASSACNIDKMSRKCCQSCRLQKCKDVGMSREYLGSKMKKGNSNKEKKGSAKKLYKRSECSSDVSSNDSPPNEQDIELENMISSLTIIHNSMYKKSTAKYSDDLKENFCTAVDQQLVCIIDWAKRLPGYGQLEITDQAILLQAGWVDLIVLHWLFNTVQVNYGLNFSDNFTLNEEEAEILGFKNIYSLIVGLARRAKNYNIDEVDIACLKAIALSNSESSNLVMMDSVDDLISRYTAALQYYSNSRHRNDLQKYAKLILILPQLKYIANQLIEFLYAMKMKSAEEQTVLSDLIVEMLEAKQRL